ncbi:uncharacterized protein LOC129739036 [Uranotaenia lowii]|uniref:uncharacterized protein LOC129739036 n=1 Tax=Uranotaenia lowii TaxID=190385 RepID=UPI002478F3A9|nr:uncharacterized protein LOC129739036 [Uranotaenia lowii]
MARLHEAIYIRGSESKKPNEWLSLISCYNIEGTEFKRQSKPESPRLCLKGGTFYQDSDPPIRSYYKDFYGLGHKSHNGHQRPFAAPLIQKQRYPSDPSNPFSNFRDFADINVSNDAGQYSEYYVVYANKHSEEKPLKNKINHKSDKNVIRNIKDQLDIIDKEIKDEHKKHKLSKTKVKLFKSKNQFKFKSTFQSVSNSPADNDFMLALS